LAETPDLRLDEVIVLDRVQKRLPITDDEAVHLKQQKLIEGRKPNYYISALVAKHAGKKAQYIKTKGLDDDYYKKIVCDYLTKFGEAKRSDIDDLLLDKLPDILDSKQKANKIKNFLQSLKLQGVIDVKGKCWRMSKE